MKIVRFLHSSPPYTTGDVAGFDGEMADRLIRQGVAEPYHKPEAQAAAVNPPKVETMEERKVIHPTPAPARPGPVPKQPVKVVTKG